MKKESDNTRVYFNFFGSYLNTIEQIPDDKTWILVTRAILRYGILGEEPSLGDNWMAKAIWESVYPNLKNSRDKYSNGCKGGAPRGNKNAYRRRTATEEEENGNAFVPPTLEEVKAYIEERNNTVDPEKFFAYYEANGWKVGNSPMKNWKAAVMTWERNGKSNYEKRRTKNIYPD